MTIPRTHLQQLLDEQHGSTAIPMHPLHWPHVDLDHWFNSQQPSAHRARHLLWWVRLQKRQLAYVVASIVGGLSLAYTASFLWPRQLVVGYAQTETCIANPILFPGLLQLSASDRYAVEHKPAVRIAGQTIFSASTCVQHTAQPQENADHALAASLFGIDLLQNKLAITSKSFPSVQPHINDDSRVVAHKPIMFALSGEDEVFTYRLRANGQESYCTKETTQLECNLEPLNLTQGQSYPLILDRLFDSTVVGELYSGTVTTIEPVAVASSSVAASSIIYDAPNKLQLTFNKPLARVDGLRLESLSPAGRTSATISYTIDGSTLTITLAEPLARETSFELTLEQAEASDQSLLAAAYVLPFATSGGPKVSSISIGSYKVTPGASFSISFDSELAGSQNVASFVTVSANGKSIEANVTASGNRLVVTPAVLGKCESFTVTVKPGLTSAAGIGNGQGWQYGSRTTCQTSFSIGTSVLGRSIAGYRFGGGNDKIIFVGGTHGDEKSSVYTLNSLVDHLEANPNVIASSNTIIIIPNLNPDGFAQNRRTNANNVDLNRNFPSNSWKSGVSMPNGEFLDYGGGTAPLSEPESKALANYVLGQNPKLVLTYHSSGGMVIANESGNSWDITYNYGKKSSLWARKNSELGTTFNYDTTGAFEDWLHDKHGIPALLIELWNDTANHFSGQKNAMLYTVGL